MPNMVAVVFASSVLPTPGGPSISTGFFRWNARYTAVAIWLLQM